MLREQLISVGRQLYERGLQSARSGNISARDGDRFVITRTGSNLGRLTRDDTIAVEIDPDSPIPENASCEAPVHRAIYNATDAGAVVHAHPLYAIALAQATSEPGIAPVHNEALFKLKWVPIIDSSVQGKEGGEAPEPIAERLIDSCSVIIRKHGAFTVGPDLDDALYKMLLLEDVCKIASILLSIDKPQEARAPKDPMLARLLELS